MAGVGRFFRTLRAGAHSLCGWIAYRLGWHTFARQRFEQVLLLRGADFRAYVHLGRIAFDLGDYASWRREFEHARRADPIRFARLRHPLELFEPRLAGTQFDALPADADFDTTGARATWRALHPFGGDVPYRLRPHGDGALGSDFDALLPGFDSTGDGDSEADDGTSFEGQSAGPSKKRSARAHRAAITGRRAIAPGHCPTHR